MLPQLPANRYGWFVVDRAELHGYLLRALDPEAKMLEEREVAFVPLPRGIFAGSGADSIAVGVHVRWRPTGNRSQHFCTGDVFDHAIAPEFPPAINGITRRSAPDATLAIDAASRSFGDLRFWHVA